MADKKVTVIAQMKAKPENQQKVKEILLSLVNTTRKEAGCLRYDLHQSADDLSIFMFYEIWASKEALEKHLKMPHLQNFFSQADELLAQPMQATFWQLLT